MSKCRYCGYEFKNGDGSIFCPSCLNVREESENYNPFSDGGDFLAEQIREERRIDAELRKQEYIEQADPIGFDRSIYVAPPTARRPALPKKKRKAGIIDIIVFIVIVLAATGTLGKIINGVGDVLNGLYDKIQEHEITDIGVYTVDRIFENKTVYFDGDYSTEWFSFEIGNFTIEDITENLDEWDDLFGDNKDKYLNVNIGNSDEWYLIKVDLNTNGVVGQVESNSDSYCKKAWLSKGGKEICKSLDCSHDEYYYFVCPAEPAHDMYTVNFDIYNNGKNQKVKIEHNFGL